MEIIVLITIALSSLIVGGAIGLSLSIARAVHAESKAERLPQLESQLVDSEHQVQVLTPKSRS